ncbi:dTDP-4-dehydrorhamnose 3,5-epimerase [Bradyrhizobium prioriisuperbiae]|uniref:dTDP-4-dehydrorhamnose 3,5-epimerase n=1 Tax=Bradyrhizobium prioriisuperbiae TaxID=2854389 RepID=UPI0028E5697F|nr:dTDP-4-dehydrorhamnose 3,5-epimerase [Bradyrhizobium prioritasuperba]
MKFSATNIPGVWIVEVTSSQDERGLFARTFCADTFSQHGLVSQFPQCNSSWNAKKGTLRGMHYQDMPHPEIKLVRCTKGRVFDVVVDLRADAPTHRKWVGVELDANRRNAVYIPEGCAHGFLTLEDDCEVFYHMGERYVPELARGVRWNDPAFQIEWPMHPALISERDASLPDYVS